MFKDDEDEQEDADPFNEMRNTKGQGFGLKQTYKPGGHQAEGGLQPDEDDDDDEEDGGDEEEDDEDGIDQDEEEDGGESDHNF